MTTRDLIAFETRVRAAWEAGNLPCLLHLCGGNEAQLLEIFARIRPHDWVFSTHRNHYHALLKGIPEEKLFSEILAGRSMFIFSRAHNFVSSSILAGTCAIATGVAWQLKAAGASTPPPHVYCFLGDGAEEEGHFYEAALFAQAHDLPVTFIIEDNDRQVDTPKAVRRPLARSHLLEWVFTKIHRYHYTPTYPHAGSGAKPGTITFTPEAIARMQS
jgi:TPP-dependent pyruvate/acetoin dehydrogenase alpha subunit